MAAPSPRAPSAVAAAKRSASRGSPGGRRPEKIQYAGGHLADPRLREDLTRTIARRANAEDVEDLVQAALAEALGSPRLPDAGEEVRRFVFAIALQKVADHHRRRGRQRRRELADAREVAPGHRAGDHELLLLLDYAEVELPPAGDARQTLGWMLRESEGETLAEIAAADRVPAPVVRQRVSRLRRHYRSRWVKVVGAVGVIALVLLVASAVTSRRASPEIQADVATAASTQPVAPDARATSVVPAVAPVSAGAFDRAAAAAALGGIDLQACKAPGDPPGRGHATVTFAPSGLAVSAKVDPGAFAGTRTGACVAGKLRGVSVPPFSGGPTTVGKAFLIE